MGYVASQKLPASLISIQGRQEKRKEAFSARIMRV
jgi:hypothetical protein